MNYINEDKRVNLEYKGKVIFDKIFDAPEVFKLVIDNDEIISIENLKFQY